MSTDEKYSQQPLWEDNPITFQDEEEPTMPPAIRESEGFGSMNEAPVQTNPARVDAVSLPEEKRNPESVFRREARRVSAAEASATKATEESSNPFAANQPADSAAPVRKRRSRPAVQPDTTEAGNESSLSATPEAVPAKPADFAPSQSEPVVPLARSNAFSNSANSENVHSAISNPFANTPAPSVSPASFVSTLPSDRPVNENPQGGQPIPNPFVIRNGRNSSPEEYHFQVPSQEGGPRIHQVAGPQGNVNPPPMPPFDPAGEDDFGKQKPGSPLVPILAVLMVIVAIICGIVLPDWTEMKKKDGFIGSIAEIVAPIQQKALSLVGSTQSSSAGAITSFTAGASGNTAPVTFTFVVNTNPNIQELHILDASGTDIYIGKTGDQECITLDDRSYWNITYTVNASYEGTFFVYAIDQSGKKSDVLSSEAFTIGDATVELEPVMGFKCSPTVVSVLPATVTFAVEAGPNVSSLRIVDDKGVAVATVRSDDDIKVVYNSSGSVTWTFSVDFTESYSGNLSAQYMTETSLSYLPSGYSVAVQLGSDPVPTATPVFTSVLSTPTTAPTATPTATDAPATAVPVSEEEAESPDNDEEIIEEADSEESTETEDLPETSDSAKSSESSNKAAVIALSMLGSDSEDELPEAAEAVDEEPLAEEEELVESNAEEDYVEEDYVEEDYAEEDDVEEDYVDEDYVGEDYVEEDYVEEDYVEEDDVEEEPAEEEPVEEDYIEEEPVEEDYVEEDESDEASEDEIVPVVASVAVATKTTAPSATPLPDLSASADASADPTALKLKETLYSGTIGGDFKTVKTYARTNAIKLLEVNTSEGTGSEYAGWSQSGVITYRGGALRQNAAYGTADVAEGKLSVKWKKVLGGMKTSSGSVYGVTDPGQPLIVKWSTDVRAMMQLNEGYAGYKALKEVMVAAQDGYVHFYCLEDGEETRDAIELGAPSHGGLSLSATGAPILGVGQYYSKLAKKTVKNGYHLLNLITNTKAALIPGDGSDKNTNYSGFTGSALFDKTTGTMVVAGMNGVLYTNEQGTLRDTVVVEKNSVTIHTGYQGYKSLASGQDKADTMIEGSVAMYGSYVYYGDKGGILHCVDLNSLSCVWAVDLGETITSTPALSVSEDGVCLYIGTEKAKAKGTCGIYCFDALSGKQIWKQELPELTYAKKGHAGVTSAPVVGENELEGRLIYTYGDSSSSTTVCLNAEDGSKVWSKVWGVASLSSPIAIYTDDGTAWIVQAQQDGKVSVLTAEGVVTDTLALEPFTEGESVLIEASPAAYKDTIIIGTTGSKEGGVYALTIE